MNVNIDFYNQHFLALTDQYNSVSFEQVHSVILNHLPTTGRVLDVGCGSGRDAFALASHGLEVTAVDPAVNMLELAQKTHPHENITWLSDRLPDLANTQQLNQQYDFILLSAVWMHIQQKDREAAFKRLRSLLAPGGQMVIYLRHGKFTDERLEIAVSLEELESLADQFNLQATTLSTEEADNFKRAVYWQVMLFKNAPH